MFQKWGQNKSFKGKWSNGSDKWNKVTDELKGQLNAYKQEDGQFFMSYDDFIDNYNNIDFVHVNMNAFSDTLADGNTQYSWVQREFYGEWIPGKLEQNSLTSLSIALTLSIYRKYENRLNRFL